LQPDSGKVKLADQIQVNYFEQHRDTLNPKDTVQKAICPEGDYVTLQGRQVYVKSYLSRFHFRPEQHDMPVEKLSGGEQSRLLIARLMLTSANVLILDEPTNDLDISTLDVLKDALDQFQGAVILVTHDRFFMDQVCDSILAFVDETERLPSEEPGQLIMFASFLQWQEWRALRLKEISQLAKAPQSSNSGAGLGSSTGPATQGKKRKLSFKEQRELDGMEEFILKREALLTHHQKELDDPKNATNPTRLIEAATEVANLQSEIEKLYARWTELSGN
jgi:ATP-binding cassette subfamily F protein uup